MFSKKFAHTVEMRPLPAFYGVVFAHNFFVIWAYEEKMFKTFY